MRGSSVEPIAPRKDETSAGGSGDKDKAAAVSLVVNYGRQSRSI